MMKVEISPAIKADPILLGAVRRDQDLFEAKYGRGSDAVSADRSLHHDDLGRPLIRLEISDEDGSAEAVFKTEDLEDVRRLMYRLNWIWGDLLQIQSHKLLDEIRAA